MQAASLSEHLTSARIYFTNNFEMVSGEFRSTSTTWLDHSGAGSVWFREGCTMELGSHAIVYFSGLHIGAASCRATGLNTDAARRITMERDYTLTDDTFFSPWAQADTAVATPYYDLNGHSQTISHLACNSKPKYAIISSEKPCTLKLVSTTAGSHDAPFLFRGALSLWHDTVKTETLTAPCVSTGSLTVTKGTLVLSGSGKWAGDEITVGGTGTLSCQGAGSLTTGKHVLTVESGGSLAVGDGVTLRTRSATFGRVSLEAGETYTMAAIAALLSDAGETSISVSGDGSLVILSEWDGWPEVGTATSVRIPRGTVAEIANDDVARVEALESIETGANSEILITATSPIEISASISGQGAIVASGGGTVTLSGDNSGLVAPGHFEFVDTPVAVASEYALGGGDTAACAIKTTTANSGAIRFLMPAGVKTITNHVEIAMSGADTGDANYYFGSEAADERVVQAGSFSTARTAYGTWNNLYLRYNVEFIGDAFTMTGLPAIRSESGKNGDLRRIGGATTAVKLGSSSNQAIIYLGNLRLAPASLSAPYGIAPSAANNVIFERDSCLGADTPLAPYGNGTTTATFFNLNGHGQTVSRLRQINGSASNFSVIATPADAPATLTAAGTSTAAETVRYRMIGPISYVHNTPASTTFADVKLAATGDLTVSAGAVTFANGSGWTGTNVTVKSGGTLNFLSEYSLTDDSLHNLVVEAGGSLQVADGVTIVVNNATFGGVSLEPLTTYTMDEVRALAEGEGVALTGGGSIRMQARSIAGDWTGWPEPGTASVAAIPDNVAAEVLDGDIEKVAALSSIELGIGASIAVKTTGERPLTISAGFVGSGRIWILGDSGTVTNVVLVGDNRRLVSPGGFSFSNTWAVVASRYGLGGADTGRAEFYPAAPFSSNRSRLTFTGDATANDVAVKSFGGMRVGYDTTDVTFRQRGDMDLYTDNSDIRRATFFNDFAVVGGTFNSTWTRIDTSQSTLRLVEDCVVSSLQGVYGSAGVFEFGPASVSASQWQLAMEQSLKTVRFVKEDALNISKGGFLLFYDGSSTDFRLDLNGYSQTAAAIRGNLYGNQYQEGAYADNYSLCVTSAVPATLTLNGTSSWKEAVRVVGQASLTYAGTATQTVGYVTSTTRGALTVTSGAVALERNAKWTGGDVVLNGGTLIVRESAMTNTFGVGRATVPNLYVNGGKLRLEGTSTVPTVHSIFVKGKCLERKTYSAANCGWIEGDGSIRATRDDMGAILFVR